MLITLTAARAGTGVTTTAVGLAAAWPRPVLLVEADPCGYSTILAGTLGATVPVGPGLLDAAMAARAGELAAGLDAMLIDLPGTNARVLPGLASVAQRRTFTPSVWSELATALAGWAHATGIDVLVDTGPLSDAAHPAPWHALATPSCSWSGPTWSGCPQPATGPTRCPTSSRTPPGCTWPLPAPTPPTPPGTWPATCTCPC